MLILVRTNTLVSFFKRTYEATLRDDVGGDFTLPEENIAVMTVDQFLCLHHSYIRSGASCRLEKWMDKTKRNETCELCKQDLLETIFAPDSTVNASQTYGCILVDEVQSLEPDKRKACYLTTQRTNPFREFYIFGDVQQVLQEDAIGADEEGNSKGKTIRAPATGFGRQIVVKKDYRCTKSALKDVQELFRKRFEGQGIDIEEYQSEMVTKEAPAQATFEVIAPYKCEPTELRHPNCHKQIKEMLDELLNAGGNTRNDILVLCNAKEVLKVAFGAVSDWAKAHNVTFHCTHTEHGKDRKEERLQFWNTPKTVWLTTIDCAQRWTFEKVLFLYDVSLRANQANALCYTAITRAKSMLRILVDKSQLAQ